MQMTSVGEPTVAHPLISLNVGFRPDHDKHEGAALALLNEVPPFRNARLTTSHFLPARAPSLRHSRSQNLPLRNRRNQLHVLLWETCNPELQFSNFGLALAPLPENYVTTGELFPFLTGCWDCGPRWWQGGCRSIMAIASHC